MLELYSSQLPVLFKYFLLLFLSYFTVLFFQESAIGDCHFKAALTIVAFDLPFTVLVLILVMLMLINFGLLVHRKTLHGKMLLFQLN